MSGSRRWRDVVLVVIGIVTPIGVLAVNASAFIMQHLNQFRVTIAVCALLSGLILNGLAAFWALGLARRRAAPLFSEYRHWVIGIAVIAVLASACIAAYLTYVGLNDPRHLPNPVSVLGALFALGMPFGLTYVQRRLLPRSLFRAVKPPSALEGHPGTRGSFGGRSSAPAPETPRYPDWPPNTR
jgi:hypothetical protein